VKTAFISPLRYPGGKGKLGPYFARILASQPVVINTYAEPYAGVLAQDYTSCLRGT